MLEYSLFLKLTNKYKIHEDKPIAKRFSVDWAQSAKVI